MSGAARRRALGSVAFGLVASLPSPASHAQAERGGEGAGAFSFAVAGSVTSGDGRGTEALLRAIEGSAARFVVHFDLSAPSTASCGDLAMDRRRDVLDTSVKPVIPVVGASGWAACGGESLERLGRLGDTFFANDESLGQARLPWLRQSSLPRFRRYRENVQWQVGPVLFTTVNLPENNNNFRMAAGRNGEFEERSVANRAWVERTFRVATERRLAGVVIFIDAAPRFGVPLRVPDARSSERDGYYEWKLAFRDSVSAFRGQVLLIQAHDSRGATASDRGVVDRPLRDAAGHPVANLARMILPDGAADTRWLRVDVDPRDPTLFHVAVDRAFDDPSGELYGPNR